LKEAELLALTQGGSRPERLDAHLDACGSCRELLAEWLKAESPTGDPAPVPAALARGTTLGRYVVLERRGAGGMGVVYAAYDTELERKVALKLLHPGGPETLPGLARARLLREAQAAARLDHPNVVTVFDVGTLGSRVFLTMEYVDGQTLAHWRRAAPPWRQVLDAYLQAGEGLAAAHAAGLVHRDFKPENVLIDTRGRVRVTDFGLARAEAPASRPEGTVPPPAQGTSGGLTDTGGLAGTPAYMSPEQLAGRIADPRSDQYAFCVSLYEALYQERPFDSAAGFEALREAVLRGEVRAPPSPHRVPAWLRKVVLRGLRREPGERFASMEALLQALRKPPTSRARRLTAMACVLAAVAALVVAAGGAVQARRSLCTGARARLAGLWDDSRRAQAQAAFAATGLPHAADSFREAAGALEAQLEAWARHHQEVCAATRLRGEQSEEVLDLRMGCLERRRQELDALSEQLARADAKVVQRSMDAVKGLSSLKGCDDPQALRLRVPLPPEAEARARIEEVDRQLVRVGVLTSVSKHREAAALARDAAKASEALGYLPLRARALTSLGKRQANDGQDAEAERSLRQAVLAALEVGDGLLAARALVALADLKGIRHADWSVAASSLDYAEALMRGAGRDVELHALAEYVRGAALQTAGRGPEALEHFRASLRMEEREHGPQHPHVADALGALAATLSLLGRWEEALEGQQRMLELTRQTMGPRHISMAIGQHNLGMTYLALGRFEEALAACHEALRLREALFGPEHARSVTLLNNIGVVHQARGDEAQAAHYFERALAIALKAHAPTHEDVAMVTGYRTAGLCALGRCAEGLRLQEALRREQERVLGPRDTSVGASWVRIAEGHRSEGDWARAAQAARQGLSILEAADGDPETVARALFILGESERLRGRPREALAPLGRAHALLAENAGARHPSTTEAQLALGAAHLSLREEAAGLRHVEEALAVRESLPGFTFALAEARFAAASALEGRVPARAWALAARALEGFSAGSLPLHRKRVAELRAWQRRAAARKSSEMLLQHLPDGPHAPRDVHVAPVRAR
jgi:tetratricopeptide (TPR) repeat protein